MDRAALFGTATALWKKYSAYEKRTQDDDVRIVPARGAAEINYNITDFSEKILLDALEIGLAAISEQTLPQAYELSFQFVRKYGLLNLANEETITARYGENLSDLVGYFQNLYMHLSASYYYDKTDDEQLRDIYAVKINSLSVDGLSFALNAASAPTIQWNVSTLYGFLDLIYTMYITDPEQPLRICKHCGEAFIAKMSKNEFCSPQCRNQFHVYKSRAKHNA